MSGSEGPTRKSARLSAAYATDVTHYRHVMDAMASVVDEVTVFRPYQLSRGAGELISRAPLPAPFQRLIARRVTDLGRDDVRARSIGVVDLAGPVFRSLGIQNRPSIIRLRGLSAAASVGRRMRPVDYFQFVELTGYRVVTSRRRPTVCVCEHRNLHYEVFEEDLHVHLGFPFEPMKYPLRSQFDTVFGQADHIVVYSEIARQSFLQRGFAQERVSVVPLGLRPPSVTASEGKRDPYTLVYVGRLDAYKGIDVAVAAVRELGRPYRLIVAGSGTAQASSWIRRQPQVEYVGVLDKEQLASLWATAAAMLSPSIESFGFAVMEALFHGVPVLTRETTGATEFLPAGLRRVVEGRDPGRWAQAVRDLAGFSADVIPHRADLAEVAASVTWDASQASQVSLIRRLLEGAGTPA